MAGSNAPIMNKDSDSDDSDDDADESSDEEEELTPEQKRALLKERLAREYEEEAAKGCTNCSA